MLRHLRLLSASLIALVLVGCAVPQKNIDYTAYKASNPASILVLPPLNTSVEPIATQGVLAQTTFPLAESGYYVIPVGVMQETFIQNGLHSAEDIHQVPHAKLREIFNADAVLYMTVSQYGTSYQVIGSTTTVAVDATLVDLRTGVQLWEGSKTLVDAGNSGGGLIGMLVQAVVDQVVNTLTDRSYTVAGMTNRALLSAGQPGGLLHGPRSPAYGRP